LNDVSSSSSKILKSNIKKKNTINISPDFNLLDTSTQLAMPASMNYAMEESRQFPENISPVKNNVKNSNEMNFSEMSMLSNNNSAIESESIVIKPKKDNIIFEQLDRPITTSVIVSESKKDKMAIKRKTSIKTPAGLKVVVPVKNNEMKSEEQQNKENTDNEEKEKMINRRRKSKYALILGSGDTESEDKYKSLVKDYNISGSVNGSLHDSIKKDSQLSIQHYSK
jgi:hypothetical protein